MQRRQRVAAQIRAVDPDLAMVEFSLEAPEVWRELFTEIDSWMPDFWAALHDHESGLERAKVLTSNLHRMRRSFDAVARFRPWRGLYREFATVLDNLSGVWEATLTAYEASTLIEAQRAQRSLQACIDEAGDALGRWNDAADQLIELVTLRSGDMVIACITSAIDAGSSGRQIADRLLARTAVTGPLPPGVVEMLAGYAQITRLFGEHEAVLDRAEHLVAVLRHHGPRAVSLLDDDFYFEQFARALSEIQRSGSILYAIATVCGGERMSIDTALRYLHDTVESATRHPLALVAALENGTGYRAAYRSGAAKCIRTVRTAGHPLLAEDLDLDIRNVVAHRGYRLPADGGVDVLNDSGNLKKHVSAAELVDLVSGAGIHTLALIAGTVLFAAEAGLDIPRLVEEAGAYPIEQKLTITAVAHGWSPPHIIVSDDGTTIEIHDAPPITIAANVTESHNLTVVLGMVTQLTPSVERILVHDGQDVPLTVDVALARNTMNGEGDYHHALKWLPFTHSLRRGDLPATPITLWRALVLARARQAVAPGAATAIRNLIALRVIVRECGDHESDPHLTELIQDFRNHLTPASGMSLPPLHLG
ncbi:MAG: hypothetical protein M3548_08550 [Actinomycetota bacterium]|nr:hypothetical protein [Actinomycetota bacterium]